MKDWICSLCQCPVRNKRRKAYVKYICTFTKAQRYKQIRQDNHRSEVVNKKEHDPCQKVDFIALIVLLSVLPSLLFYVFPQLRTIKTPIDDENFSKLDFLAVIIALAAYLAGVRLAVLGRLGSEPKPTNPSSLKRRILFLIPSDFNLIISGSIVAVKLFYTNLIPPEITWAGQFATFLFILAVVYLVVMHIWSWFESACKYYK